MMHVLFLGLAKEVAALIVVLNKKNDLSLLHNLKINSENL